METYSPLAATASGLRLLARRPWVIVGWAVVVFPFALALTALAVAFRSGLTGLTGRADLLDVVYMALIALSIPLIVLDGAAVRSVTRPDSSGFLYLRAGLGVFGRMAAYGLQPRGRNLIGGKFLFWSGAVGAVGLYAAFMASPHPTSLWVGAASLLLLVPSALLDLVRGSLAGVCAVAGHPYNSLTRSWLLTKGHEAALVVMMVLTWAVWVALSAAIAWGAAALLNPGSADPAWIVLYDSVPTVGALGWATLLSPPVLILAGAVTLVFVLREVVCERAMADTYRTLTALRPDVITGPAAVASS
jgi:hypothetical protein